MILKIITVRDFYELKVDEIKATEIINQMALKRPEQTITLGKSEGAPYQIGIKPLHVVGYELIPDAMEKAVVINSAVSEAETLKAQIEVETLKSQLDAIKNPKTKKVKE